MRLLLKSLKSDGEHHMVHGRDLGQIAKALTEENELHVRKSPSCTSDSVVL
jgi:hypothetical protein